ncbi:MAG: hypothetical protein M0026_05210 [Nocardiopsaceae bacterium]|nr:hypothetical protein [Nocardiopsaceae bacterium]
MPGTDTDRAHTTTPASATSKPAAPADTDPWNAELATLIRRLATHHHPPLPLPRPRTTPRPRPYTTPPPPPQIPNPRPPSSHPDRPG